MTDAIKVAVRVRPFLPREYGEKCVVYMPDRNTTTITDAETGIERSFQFDYSYWSHEEESSHSPYYDTQESIFNDLGVGILENVFDGFNACLFAYGQTGSGKSHSVLGTSSDPGLLPNICGRLFSMIRDRDALLEGAEFNVTVSFLEIYNERIKDLLMPPAKGGESKVLELRQHPDFGVYTPGLTESVATSYEDIQSLLDFGTKARTVGATNMNSVSSRSHAVFAIKISQKFIEGGAQKQRRAVVNLVDLAGSERQKKTGAEGDRLKEGAMINQSLSTLGVVISKLADGRGGGHVPFRNSKLTFLLSESLSGNSKTIMVAAISPAQSNIDETISTLRFAQTCKKVSTNAKCNEESDEKIVAALQSEIERLKAMMAEDALRLESATNEDFDMEAFERAKEEMAAELKEREALAEKYKTSWQEMVRKTEEQNRIRQEALKQMGLNVSDIGTVFEMEKNCPYLINISDDPLLTGCLMYFIRRSSVESTSLGSAPGNTITLTGLAVQPRMCYIKNTDNNNLYISVPDGCENTVRVLVNGRKIPQGGRELRHHDRIVIGRAYAFRIVIPVELQMAKDRDLLQGATDTFEWDVEAVLQEIVTDDSNDYQGASKYVEELRERIGDFKAQQFLRNFGRALRFIEEANDITRELRPRDKLKFSLEVVVDVMSYDCEQPELIVRVWAGKTAKQRFQEAVAAMHQPKLLWKVLKQVKVTGAGMNLKREHANGNLLYAWELPKFLHRLELMRSAYQNWYETGEIPYEGRAEEDPWHEIGPREMSAKRQLWQAEAQRPYKERISFMDAQLRTRNEQIERLRVALNSTGFLNQMMNSDGNKIKPLRVLSPGDVNNISSSGTHTLGHKPTLDLQQHHQHPTDDDDAIHKPAPSKWKPKFTPEGHTAPNRDMGSSHLQPNASSTENNQQNIHEIVRIQSHAKEISRIFGNMEDMYNEWDNWMNAYKIETDTTKHTHDITDNDNTQTHSQDPTRTQDTPRHTDTCVPAAESGSTSQFTPTPGTTPPQGEAKLNSTRTTHSTAKKDTGTRGSKKEVVGVKRDDKKGRH
eukprot:GHVR01105178.1.p1 GENE.GHVR01105178.1~~GHVR01105178.1.p1  ORF type:complete len:1050 (+),score=298.05 GHVR01105178.1:81-3230(+)